MKKRISILMCFCFMITLAQNEDKIVRDLNKKNQISEVYTYDFKQNGDSLLLSHDYYNKDGNIIKNIILNKDGKTYLYYTYEYNDYGSTKITGFNNDQVMTTQILFEYDEKGNQIKYQQNKPNGEVVVEQKRLYNSENKNIELHSKKDKDFYLKQKYFYNTDGYYSKIETYNLSQEIVLIREYNYDNNRNLLTVFDITKNKILLVENKYDDHNLLMEKKLGDNKKVQLKYDAEGNKIQELTIENEKMVRNHKYIYKKF